MVSSPMADGLIYNIKMSSVGPAYATGPDTVFEPENMDLAMKLHYLRVIYYFGSQAFAGQTILAIKEPMFTWLNKNPVTSGRFRRAESGRAYIKCNDCGVRLVEAKCVKTLDEWLEMKDIDLERLLVSNHIIGPELGFSPLLFIQLTTFKCGGTALGLSWAHVLGDAFTAAEFINSLGRAVAGLDMGPPIELAQSLTKSTTSNGPPKVVEDPPSIKRVGPVGDNWVTPTKFKMEAFSFRVGPTQLGHLQSKLSSNGSQFTPFEAISAMIWKCIAKIRGKELEPNVVTICKKGEGSKRRGMLTNGQLVSVVKVDFPIVEASPSLLATLVRNEASDDRINIEKAMEREHGLPDFIVYGANLTFVDLEDANFYEFEYKGQKPLSVGFRIDGVGDQGATLLLPSREVIMIFPEYEILDLKFELKREGIMA